MSFQVQCQAEIDTQTLAYKFPFSDFSFPTDNNFLILAEGTKSALFQVRRWELYVFCPIIDLSPQTDITFPLNPPSTSDLYKPKSDIKLPSTNKLEAFRRLILGAKVGSIEVAETISEVLAKAAYSRLVTDQTVA